jgi:tight adherence protein B
LTAPVAGALAAVLASAGAYLVATSTALGANRLRPRGRVDLAAVIRQWLAQAGLADAGPKETLAAIGILGVAGGLAAFVLFGALVPSVVAAGFCACVPVSTFRRRRRDRMAAAAEAWPRLLEELRLLTGSMGRSVPQALFEVGRRAPEDWRPAFAAAEREWLLTTDFPRTAVLLKDRLADPTVDVVCETLIVAQEVGGTDLDRRLSDLIEDRTADVQERKDAASRQAGVRFARTFVLLVPLGMTLAGLSIGSGRQAYTTAGGQLAVVVGLLSVVACWLWSGRLMRLPPTPRVFR